VTLGDDPRLVEALADIAARGPIGQPLDAAIAHARRFVAALPSTPARVADLGSGGGLPGLVLAVDRPDLSVTLIERRRTRADLLCRAVAKLRLAHVEVVAADVSEVVRDGSQTFDVVTARSFAAPPVTLRWAAALLEPGGMALIADSPADGHDRWTPEMVAANGFVDHGRELGIRRLTRITS
jgi:16S rRNA (guanine527-N7)-methyltransferase